MPSFYRQHLTVIGRTETHPYTSNLKVISDFQVRPNLNRRIHARKLVEMISNVVPDPSNLENQEFLYLTFRSAPGYLLNLTPLTDSKENTRLTGFKQLLVEDENGNPAQIIEATACLKKKGIVNFLKKVSQYASENTSSGKPKHLPLIANIENIDASSMRNFWQEPSLPFPPVAESRWWEVWFSVDDNENLEDSLLNLQELFGFMDVTISSRQLFFPKNHVFFVKATARQLRVLLKSEKFSELRAPKEPTSFFTGLEQNAQEELIHDLRARVQNLQQQNPVSVCLIDTGVNRLNPLLEDLVPEANLDSINPEWTNADETSHGHGTPMAGLILYGDLTEALSSLNPVNVIPNIESIKMVRSGKDHEPSLYGALTVEAVGRGVIMNGHNNRIACMAISSSNEGGDGRPSSWSSAIDQLLYNQSSNLESKLVFIVSAGNLDYQDRINSPLQNDESPIDDPGQSFNALTVGSYTDKDHLDTHLFPGATLTANRGSLSACSRTSVKWARQWAKKPDFVMEGGNNGIYQNSVIDPESLQLLSTGLSGRKHPHLISFSDTSASVALASKFAAELYHMYPTYRAETIRALIVHSARWTPTMLGNRSIEQLSPDERRILINRTGFGVPEISRALYTANNSLTLIVERSMQPFILDGASVKSNEFHLFDLPWPAETLTELFDTPVELNVTLSYYIEPNPGNRQYDSVSQYRSAGLRFKMLDSNESVDAFKGRISKRTRRGDYLAEGSEDWILGAKLRDKGSLHRDIWKGTAADLVTKNRIAVYPVGGWWKDLKKELKHSSLIHYSLIVSIDAPDIDLDICTPVLNELNILV